MDSSAFTPWQDTITDEIVWNTPFEIHGRKALLLGVVKTEEGICLWLAYERRPPPKKELQTDKCMRAVFATMQVNSESYFPEQIRIDDTPIPLGGGQVGTVSECFDPDTEFSRRLLERIEKHGALPAVDTHMVHVAQYRFDESFDYDALRRKNAYNVILDFPENAEETFIEKSFTLPLAGEQETRIDYTEPFEGGNADAAITGIILFKTPGDDGLDRYLIAASPGTTDEHVRWAKDMLKEIWPSDHRLVFVEYACAPANSLSFYTDHYLYAPLSTDKYSPKIKLAQVNGHAYSLPCTGQGTCCIGFVPAEQTAIDACLLQRFHILPPETIHIPVEN